jgi:hypothetical protein
MKPFKNLKEVQNLPKVLQAVFAYNSWRVNEALQKLERSAKPSKSFAGSICI